MADIKIKAAFNRADLGNAVVETDAVADGIAEDNAALTVIVDAIVADEALMLKIKNALPA